GPGTSDFSSCMVPFPRHNNDALAVGTVLTIDNIDIAYSSPVRWAYMCPKCFSAFLKIRKRSGLERLMIALTGKRKYWCTDCCSSFRAVDRRELQRASSADLLGSGVARKAA